MKNDVFAALSKKTENRSVSAVKGLTELFGLTGEIKVTSLPIDCLREKSNHPFKVINDEKLTALAKSIKENGLMEPIIVRPIETGLYEILAGHRRTRASQLNGEREIGGIIIKADDELANRIMISTNFQQRDAHFPSEIAKSYLIRYNDLKNRKKVRDENSNGWNSDDKIDKIMEKEFMTSKSKVYMYLRINRLIPELLEVLDNKKLNLKIAVELSYLREPEQYLIYDFVFCRSRYKLDLKKAVFIKQESAKRTLDKDDIERILAKQTAVDGNAVLSFSKSEITKYKGKFENIEIMKQAIIQFLENYGTR